MMKAWSPTWGMGTLDYQPDVATFKADSGAVNPTWKPTLRIEVK